MRHWRHRPLMIGGLLRIPYFWLISQLDTLSPELIHSNKKLISNFNSHILKVCLNILYGHGSPLYSVLPLSIPLLRFNHAMYWNRDDKPCKVLRSPEANQDWSQFSQRQAAVFAQGRHLFWWYAVSCFRVIRRFSLSSRIEIFVVRILCHDSEL